MSVKTHLLLFSILDSGSSACSVLLRRHAGKALEQLMEVGSVGEAAFFRNALNGERG